MTASSSVSPSILACRSRLGGLASHGIEATRSTGTAPGNGSLHALLVAADDRCWLATIWDGQTPHPLIPQPGVLTLDETIAALDAWRCEQISRLGLPAPGLLVLAPGLDPAEIPSGRWDSGSEPVPVIAGSLCRKAVPLAEALLGLISPVLSPEATAHWRLAVAPEIGIQSPHRHRTPTAVQEELPLLLDYDQERCARLDLEPGEEAEHASRNFRLRLVTGVAGCGKTLILLHRAALLGTHFPKAKILLVTHNRPLREELVRRLPTLPGGERAACLTFYQWLQDVAGSGGGDYVKTGEKRRWIEDARTSGSYPFLEKMSPSWIAEEMDWMCDHDLAGDAYLEADRKGRGTRLSKSQRRDMLRLLREYRATLRENHRRDWSEWPLHILEAHGDAVPPNSIDYLLIDEAQFFAPVWLTLLRSALKPSGHLFLCADRTQGFLRRRVSWAELGMEVRSRSICLRRPYRNTRAILEFARDFYMRRIPEDPEPLNLPDPEWLSRLEPGRPPEVLPTGLRQDPLRRVASELRHLQDRGFDLRDVLIILAGRALSSETVVQHLNRHLRPDAAALAKEGRVPRDSALVVQLMASAGLERPVVFVLGLDDLIAEESDGTLSEEERGQKSLEHTRQIYVGLTRAMDHLVLFAQNERLLEAFGTTPPPSLRQA